MTERERGREGESVPALQQQSYQVNASRSISCSLATAGDSRVIRAQLDELSLQPKAEERTNKRKKSLYGRTSKQDMF